MVKGISRQVIVVKAPDRELFEQAIFILKDDAVREGITDEKLLEQAGAAILPRETRGKAWLKRGFWACTGALITGAAWTAAWFL